MKYRKTTENPKNKIEIQSSVVILCLPIIRFILCYQLTVTHLFGFGHNTKKHTTEITVQ